MIALGEAGLMRAVAATGERKPGPRRPVVLP